MARLLGAVVAGFFALILTLFAMIAALGAGAHGTLVALVSSLAAAGAAALVLKAGEKTASALNTAGSPSHDELFQVTLAELRNPRRLPVNATALFTLTLIVFVAFAVQSDSRSMVGVVCIVGVLLFHELGHAVAMRAFGYSDVKIFFIPFLGAATAGLKSGAPVWQQAIVLLAGPLPGLALGSTLAATQPAALAGFPQLVPMLIGLNLFNLLPVEPLDGGRLASLLVFGSSPRAGIVVSTALAVAFTAALELDAVVQGALVGGLAGAQIARWQAATVSERMRRDGSGRWAELPGDITTAKASLLRALFDATHGAEPRTIKYSLTLRARWAAARVRAAYEMLRVRPAPLRVAIPVGVLFVCGTLGIGYRLKHGLSSAADSSGEAFLRGCVSKCRQGADDVTCGTICDCSLAEIRKQAGPDFIQREFHAPPLSARATAVVDRIAAGCSADTYDRNFLKACVKNCGASQSSCEPYCRCMLSGLRGAGDRADSTLWIMKNIEQSQPTPQGAQRIAEARERCVGGVGPSNLSASGAAALDSGTEF